MDKDYLNLLFTKYSSTLYKISVIMLCNEEDAKDAVQDTFTKFLVAKKNFTCEEHEKAWLIRVNINICKNVLRFRKMHPTINYESVTIHAHKAEDIGLMDSLLQLKEKDKYPLILYYIEGYSCREMAGILKVSEVAAKKRLERARNKLKEQYEQDCR